MEIKMTPKYNILLMVVLMLFAAHPAFADKDAQASESQSTVSKNCHDTASTQADMDDCAYQDMHKEEIALHQILTDLKTRYADDPKKLKKIEKAQKAWESFAKAQLDLLYYDYTGSVEPMCAANTKTMLVLQRMAQLKEWMNTEEGDVCGGL
jgi:uncharacterized protein YecT (DUF1311 family)